MGRGGGRGRGGFLGFGRKKLSTRSNANYRTFQNIYARTRKIDFSVRGGRGPRVGGGAARRLASLRRIRGTAFRTSGGSPRPWARGAVRPLGHQRGALRSARTQQAIQQGFGRRAMMTRNSGYRQVMYKSQRHTQNFYNDNGGPGRASRRFTSREAARDIRGRLDRQDGVKWNGSETESIFQVIYQVVDAVQTGWNAADQFDRAVGSLNRQQSEAEDDFESDAIADLQSLFR